LLIPSTVYHRAERPWRYKLAKMWQFYCRGSRARR